MRRLLTVLLLACATGLAAPLTAAHAHAYVHNVLLASSPAKNSHLTSPPTEVRLTFDQPVRREFAKLALTDAGGAHYETGAITTVKNDVIVPVNRLEQPGTYTIGYQILSNDGHPVTGKITFTYGTAAASPTAAAEPTPAPTAAAAAPVADPTPPLSSGTWVWGLLIATAALLALSLRVLVRHDRNLRGAE